MKRQVWATVAAILVSMTMLLLLFSLLGRISYGISNAAPAARLPAAPTLVLLDPSSGPNDLDTPVIISGTSFAATPTVYLGDASLEDVIWASPTRLQATVPWGMEPGVYTLTVENPDGELGILTDAFTVTPGIGVWNATQLYGGKVGQIAINPITPTTVYAVAGEVGIFRSRNAGETWSLVYASDAQDLAVDSISPTTFYWGTGGLNRSDDEGDSWNYLSELVNLPFTHPTISGTVFATKRWDLGDGGGLWRSTDRGETWFTATNGLTDTAVTDLVFHPTDPMTMYLGTANGNVFLSTDAGGSWSHAAQPINSIMTLAINPRGTHELWVSSHCLDEVEMTLKSTNADHTTWIAVGEPQPAQSFESIDFPPLSWGATYSETLFGAGCWAGDLMRTVDGGDTWEVLPEAQSGKNDIALHPSISDTLYAGSKFDGVLQSEDGGDTFQAINQGLTAVVPRQLVTVPGQPDLVYAIADRDGGIYKASRGGETWEFLEVERASSGNSVVSSDPFTPTRVYVGSGATGQGVWHMDISEDSGQTWTTHLISATEQYSDCDVVWPQVLRPDPARPGLLLAGLTHFRRGSTFLMAGGIYRSTDHGENWTFIDVGQVISPVNDIAYDREITTVLYAATGGGGMLRSTDSGQIWQPMGAGVAALDHVWSIAVEPVAPYRVFAAASWPNGIYASEDHGLSWTQVNSWLNSELILCTEEEPSGLYVAGSYGLFRSTDGGDVWQRATGTLGHVPIYSLATVTATDRVILYAGTTGGFLESGEAQVLSVANSDGTLVNAGVHRYTQRGWQVYLPLLLRAGNP